MLPRLTLNGVRDSPRPPHRGKRLTAFRQYYENRLCHNVLDVRCGLAQMAQHTALDLAKGNDARELTDPCNRIQRGVVGTIRSEQEPESLEHVWCARAGSVPHILLLLITLLRNPPVLLDQAQGGVASCSLPCSPHDD